MYWMLYVIKLGLPPLISLIVMAENLLNVTINTKTSLYYQYLIQIYWVYVTVHGAQHAELISTCPDGGQECYNVVRVIQCSLQIKYPLRRFRNREGADSAVQVLRTICLNLSFRPNSTEVVVSILIVRYSTTDHTDTLHSVYLDVFRRVLPTMGCPITLRFCTFYHISLNLHEIFATVQFNSNHQSINHLYLSFQSHIYFALDVTKS